MQDGIGVKDLSSFASDKIIFLTVQLLVAFGIHIREGFFPKARIGMLRRFPFAVGKYEAVVLDSVCVASPARMIHLRVIEGRRLRVDENGKTADQTLVISVMAKQVDDKIRGNEQKDQHRQRGDKDKVGQSIDISEEQKKRTAKKDESGKQAMTAKQIAAKIGA